MIIWTDVNEYIPMKFSAHCIVLDSDGDSYLAIFDHANNQWLDYNNSNKIDNVCYWSVINQYND